MINFLQGMHIKAYQPNKKDQRDRLFINKKSAFFQPFFAEDRMFTDGSWFHQPAIMPHVQNYRPIIKRRMLRIRQQSGNTIGHSKIRTARNSYTPIIRSKVSAKKELNTQKQYSKYLVATKQTFIRQMSQIPDYARNIMKPCKIQAMTISDRPFTSRKESTGQRSWRQRDSQRLSSHKKQQANEDRFIINKNFLNGFYQSQNNIQPWDQIDEQFANY